MTFHGKERFARRHGRSSRGRRGHARRRRDTDAGHEPRSHDHGHDGPPHESPWVVTLPLILLAIPSLAHRLLHDRADAVRRLLRRRDRRCCRRTTCSATSARSSTARRSSCCTRSRGPAVYLARARRARGVVPVHQAAGSARHRSRRALSPLYKLLANKFYFDEIYQAVFAGGSRGLGTALWRVGDVALIDGALVNGSARVVGWLSGVLRRMQSGYLYHYAFAMIIGLSRCSAWYVLRLTKRSRTAMQFDWPILSVLIWLPIARRRASCSRSATAALALGRWVALLDDRCDVRHLDAACGRTSTPRRRRCSSSEQRDWIPALQRLVPRSASTASRCR